MTTTGIMYVTLFLRSQFPNANDAARMLSNMESHRYIHASLISAQKSWNVGSNRNVYKHHLPRNVQVHTPNDQSWAQNSEQRREPAGLELLYMKRCWDSCPPPYCMGWNFLLWYLILHTVSSVYFGINTGDSKLFDVIFQAGVPWVPTCSRQCFGGFTLFA